MKVTRSVLLFAAVVVASTLAAMAHLTEEVFHAPVLWLLG